MILEEITTAQDQWGKGIVLIGKKELEASHFVKKMYDKNALFKPCLLYTSPSPRD